MPHYIEVHSVYEIRMSQVHGGKVKTGIVGYYANLQLDRGVRKLRISRAQFLAWGGQGSPDPRQLTLEQGKTPGPSPILPPEKSGE